MNIYDPFNVQTFFNCNFNVNVNIFPPCAKLCGNKKKAEKKQTSERQNNLTTCRHKQQQ